MPNKRRYLYHVTDPENVESILRNGLLRGGGKRQAAFVCLSEKPLSWWQPGKVILRVDVSGLQEIEATTFLPESDEILFWGDIPAWRQMKNGLVSRLQNVTDHFRDVTKEVEEDSDAE